MKVGALTIAAAGLAFLSGCGGGTAAPSQVPVSPTAAASQPAASPTPSLAPASVAVSPASASPSVAAVSASPAAWKRPLDVAPAQPQGQFKVVSQTPSPGDKVPIFFMGAQFCPYCGAERWALVSSLERFGSLTGFGKEASNDGIDGYKPVPTYDLRPAKYDSQYISFAGKEIYDHNSKPLDQLSPAEKELVDRYDPGGGWPFLVINGQYAQLGPGYSPGLVQSQAFDTLRGQLQRGEHNAATDAISKEAGVITRLICASTGGVPDGVCKA
jgi:hypothetical protein